MIIQVLKQYDNRQTEEVYEALAWIGLMGSGGEPDNNTGLPPLLTVEWKNLSQMERLKILDSNKTFTSSNPQCQQ